MSQLPQDPQQLERYIDALLRNQPLRRAPPSLATKVLALTGRHWWQRSYRYWPRAVQGAFLLGCAALVWLTLSGAGSVRLGAGELTRAFGPLVVWMRACAELLSATHSTGSSVLHAVPGAWLYGGGLAAGALYLALFGL